MNRIITTSKIPTLLCRFAVCLIFLSEGLQKYITPDATGVGRFIKIGFSNPSFWAYFTVADIEKSLGIYELSQFTPQA